MVSPLNTADVSYREHSRSRSRSGTIELSEQDVVRMQENEIARLRNTHQDDIDCLNNRINQLVQENLDLKMQGFAIIGQIREEKNREIGNLKRQVSMLEFQRSGLERSVRTLEMHKATLEYTVQTLQETVRGLQSRVESLEHQLFVMKEYAIKAFAYIREQSEQMYQGLLTHLRISII